MARLRIGVIGLGRRWPRYRQALLALKREARVTAVYDPASAEAREEAHRLNCEAFAGVQDLIAHDGVEAVIVTGDAWFGLWPLEFAARAGKPVLCAGSLLHEPNLDSLQATLRNAAIHMTLWPTFELLAEAATQPLSDSLGTPRLVTAGRVMSREVDPLESGATLALLQGLADVFQASPRSVTVAGPEESPGFASVVLGFPGGGVGQLSLWGGPAEASRTWLEVEAEGGTLRAEMPRRLSWRDAEGRHGLDLPGGLAEVWVVDRFIHSVRAEEAPAASFARSAQALRWLQAARTSRSDGGTVRLD